MMFLNLVSTLASAVIFYVLFEARVGTLKLITLLVWRPEKEFSMKSIIEKKEVSLM